MPFFIRNKTSKGAKKEKSKKRKKLVVSGGKKKLKESNLKKDDNISSDEVLSDEADPPSDFYDSEEHETAQERKLNLAKKYLEEIVKEEKERKETEEIDDIILGRLRDDVLQDAGKLLKTVSSDIKEEFEPADITVLRCKEHNLPITCVVVSSDSKYVYSGSKDGSIVKWSLTNKVKLNYIPPKFKRKDDPNLHSTPIHALAVSFDGLYLASGDEENTIRIWNADDLSFLFPFNGHRASVTGLAFCRFTTTLYSCSTDKSVRVWSVKDKTFIETLFGHQAAITSIDVLCKDRAVTSGGIDNSVRVWKIQEESQLIYNGKLRHIDCVKRLNEKHFISCGEDGTISLWGVLKKKPAHTIFNAHGFQLSGEPNWVSSIGGMYNTEIFASGSGDGIVRLWKCENHFKSVSMFREIKVEGFVNSIEFSMDNKYLVLGVGQEHRLGRWWRIKSAKNSIQIINLKP